MKTFKLISLQIVEDDQLVDIELDDGLIISQENDQSTWLIEAYINISYDDYFQKLAKQYKRSHSFDITYLPGSASTMDEVDVIAEQLYRYLEYIEVSGSLIHALSMRHEIIEGIFHFFIDYDFYVVKEKSIQVKMQKLEQEEFVHD